MSDINVVDSMNKAKEYVDRLTKEYVEKHIRLQEIGDLIRENNIEKEHVEGYHGRELLELIQNADDAYEKSKQMGNPPEEELEVIIKYNDNKLTIINSGTCFDEKGICAVASGNNSTKTGKFIGNKGTGFRSVLNWASAVYIRSGYYNVVFSKEIAHRVFQGIKEEQQIRKQLEQKPKLYIPMLAVPKNIQDENKYDKDCGYHNNTSIEVIIDPDKSKDDYSVENQINNIDLRILLFLPNVSKIHIEIGGASKITYQRTIVEDGELTCYILQKLEDDREIKREEFHLWNTTLDEKIKEEGVEKEVQISVAVPMDYSNFERGHIYSFFPLLDTKSPFDCVMHGTYALGKDRNTINRKEENQIIIKGQLRYLQTIADEYVKLGRYDIAQRLLIPPNLQLYGWKFEIPFSGIFQQEYKLEEDYLKDLEKCKIFCTVSGDSVSIADEPRIIEGDFPHVFKGECFGKLLKPLGEMEEKTRTLIQLLGKQLDYQDEENNELVMAINKVVGSWSMEERVYTFRWWNSRFKKSLPNLLMSQKGEWLGYKDECYFLTGDFDEKILPTWVEVPSIHKLYQDELFKQTKESPNYKEKEAIISSSGGSPKVERIICGQGAEPGMYESIKFTYRDSSTIVRAINTSVKTYEQALEYVKWLWDNYGENHEWNPPGIDDSGFNFPDKKTGSVKSSKKLYYGKAYGNSLAHKLFDDSYGSFPDKATFGITEEQGEEFEYFIGKFGVKYYPSIKEQVVHSPMVSYFEEYDREIKEKGNIGRSNKVTIKQFHMPYIDNLEKLLSGFELTTEEIIEWILKDYELQECLKKLYYPPSADAWIEYDPSSMSRYQYYTNIKNYIREVFNESPWIKLHNCDCCADKEVNYSPRQLLKDGRNNQLLKEFVPVVNNQIIDRFAETLDVKREEINRIFNEILDLRDNATELSTDDFYNLMIKLQNIKKGDDLYKSSKDASKSIYRIVEKPGFEREFDENSQVRKQFLDEGKLLVKFKGVETYFPAKEAYLPSSNIVDRANTPIVCKGMRTNNENFVNLFGCLQYVKDYKIVKESIQLSDVNDDFQKYYEEFKKFASPYVAINNNIERYFNKIKITLVKDMNILQSGNLVNIMDTPIRAEKSITEWYVKATEFDVRNLSIVVENIFNDIANTPGFETNAFGQLFRETSREGREFLIKKDFGSLDVIENYSVENDIKNNFVEIIKELAPNHIEEVDSIDFDEFYEYEAKKQLVQFLKNINKDVEDLKNAGFTYDVDLSSYYERELEYFINRNSKIFKNYLFTKALDDDRLQGDFIDEVECFEYFKLNGCPSSVNFDVERIVVERFGEWRDKDYELKDADSAYAENYDFLDERFDNVLSLDDNLSDYISNDKQAQRMIYFKKEDEFAQWIKKHQIIEEKENNKPNPYEDLENKIPELLELSYSSPDEKEEMSKRTRKGKTSRGAFTRSGKARQDENSKVKGNKCERLAYNHFCEIYGEDNVGYESEAFVDLGLLKKGQEKSGWYDLYYIEDGKKIYVEVKASDDNSFTITAGELAFAKKHADDYIVCLVGKEKSKHPNIRIVDKKFWKNSKYEIELVPESYEVTF